MSVDLETQVREDRALRNAAHALLVADVANLRANLSAKSISSRIIDRIGDGAADVFDEAVEVAENHKGVLATLIAAVLLWFARNPLASLLTEDEPEEEAERDGDDDR